MGPSYQAPKLRSGSQRSRVRNGAPEAKTGERWVGLCDVPGLLTFLNPKDVLGRPLPVDGEHVA